MLELRQPRARAGLHVFSALFFYGLWYSILIAVGREESGSSLFLLLFWVAPLFSLPDVLRQLKVLAAGELFKLDRQHEVIEKNRRHVAHFHDVERIQIRCIHRSEHADEYRLSIVLRNGRKIKVDQSTDFDDVCGVADDLADLLEVEVTTKGVT